MSDRFETDFTDAGVPQLIDELGESVSYHRIVGGVEADGFPLTIDAICEDEVLDRRDDYPDELVADKQELIVSVQTADVTPQVDTDYVTRGGVNWTVMEILGESSGMSRVRCEAVELVRRGGREIER